LDTVGPYDFDGRLTTAMTAHPKRCATTGELLFFGYSFFPPYLTYHRATAQGELVQSEDIDVPGPTMIHDFNVTTKHVVWMDLPIVFDLELATQGRFPYVWSDDYGARLGVMPRTGGSADVRWFDIEPCYVFHPANAHEDESGVITVDVARYPELWRGAPEGFDRTAAPRTAASCSCSTPTTGGRRPWRVFRSPAACPSASTAPGSTTTSCSAGHGRRSAGPGPGR